MTDHPAPSSAGLRRRTRTALLLGTLVFLGTIAAVAAWALHVIDREALREARQVNERFVASAEAALNRNLLGLDMLLAGSEQLLQPAFGPDGRLEPAQARRLLHIAANQTLQLRDLLLLDEQGRVLASAMTLDGRPASAPPQDWARAAAAQPAPQLEVSLPVVVFGAAEPVLYLGRSLRSPAGQRLLLVAEWPTAVVAGILGQAVDLVGLTLTLERDDGTLVALAPANNVLLGQKLSRPMNLLDARGQAQEMPGRLRGEPALVASRPLLYRGLLVTAGLGLEAAMADARRDRQAVLGVALLLLLMVAAAGLATDWALGRLDRARTDVDQAKRTLDQALEAMGDGFLLCDAEDRVVAWNRRYAETFPWLAGVLAHGVSFERLALAGAHALMPDASVEDQQGWVQMRLTVHRQREGGYEQELPDGRVIHAVERRTAEGGVVSVFRDITRAERELARAKREADAASEAKSRFLASVSHEIRTPLNAVLGMNGLLLNTALNADQRRYAELIRSSGQTLLALINDILDLTKIEAGRMELEVVDFDPAATLSEVVSLLAIRAEARGLALGLQLAPDLPTGLRGDPSRLRQLLFNLVGNALKFTERGRVDVDARQHPLPDGRCELRVSVRDTGIGIAPELLPRLFTRFTQGDSGAARRYDGSGLGLAISDEIVRLMGGRIDVQSAPGQGSTFQVVLPLERGEGTAAVAPAPTAPPTVSRPRRILVAEDNGVNQIIIKAMLEQLGHYCDLVSDGLEVLRQVQAGPYDLVLMDVQMPHMDGEAATRAIRALPGPVARIPIVAMTANAMVQDRAASLAAGMNDHVAKPIDLNLLAQAIERAVVGPPG